METVQVWRDGTLIHLTPTEFRILAALALRHGRVVSPVELVRSARGYEASEAEAWRIIKVHVRRLRRKIEHRPDRPTFIITVRGAGYRYGVEMVTFYPLGFIYLGQG